MKLICFHNKRFSWIFPCLIKAKFNININYGVKMNHIYFCYVVIYLFILYFLSIFAQRVQKNIIVGCEWNFLSTIALKI